MPVLEGPKSGKGQDTVVRAVSELRTASTCSRSSVWVSSIVRWQIGERGPR